MNKPLESTDEQLLERFPGCGMAWVKSHRETARQWAQEEDDQKTIDAALADLTVAQVEKARQIITRQMEAAGKLPNLAAIVSLVKKTIKR